MADILGTQVNVGGAASPQYIVTQTPDNTFFGHESEVICVNVSSALKIACSGAVDGSVLIHNFQEENCSHALKLNTVVDIIRIVDSQASIILYTSEDTTLHLYTQNLRKICSQDCDDVVMDIDLAHDGRYLLTGGYNGTICVRLTHNL